MNEEPTKDLPYSSSFEERVFARFDAVDARFNAVDERFNAVDERFDTVDGRLEKLEALAQDTKPIWERALAEILKTGIEMGELKSKFGVMETEIGSLRAEQKAVRNELVDVRRALKHHVGERLDMVLKFLLDGRDDIRDAESRIRELESKFA